MALYQLVALSFDGYVHQNKASFVGTPIKHPYVFDVILHELSLRRQKIIILVGDFFRMRILSKFPVI